jgi:hypothetical protein
MTTTLRLYRRMFLVQSVLARAALVGPRRHAWAAELGSPVVDTASGKIRGDAADGINAFKGVPYDASTAGANRFMPPQKPAPCVECVRPSTGPAMRRKPLPAGAGPK